MTAPDIGQTRDTAPSNGWWGIEGESSVAGAGAHRLLRQVPCEKGHAGHGAGLHRRGDPSYQREVPGLWHGDVQDGCN
jgi:hypothetical protein